MTLTLYTDAVGVPAIAAQTFLLLAAVGSLAYRFGTEQSTRITSTVLQPSLGTGRDADTQLPQLEANNYQNEISNLRRELALQFAELQQLRKSNSQLEAQLNEETNAANRLTGERVDLQTRLEFARANVDELRKEIQLSDASASQASLQNKQIEAQVAALTAELRDRSDTIEKQKELLTHDRDIRELMGARDLYIAEVYDVAGTGTTKKPFDT